MNDFVKFLHNNGKLYGSANLHSRATLEGQGAIESALPFGGSVSRKEAESPNLARNIWNGKDITG